MVGVFSHFDRIVVISLRDRLDRRRQMVRQLGFVPFEFFDAIRPDNKGRFGSIGFHGSYLSHLEVLSHGCSVLILEDDCDFSPEAFHYSVPDCDVFYGGWLEKSDSCIIGAHCMGFSAKAAKKAHDYLSGLIEQRIGPDPVAAAEPGYDPNILPPIDGAYVWFRRAHPELKTVFHNVSTQRSSRSDCTPGRFDRIPALRPLVNTARKVLAWHG